MDDKQVKTQAEPRRATWAGCLLVLATVAVSLPVGIALTMWAAPSVGPLVARFVHADSPDLVKAIAGIVIYSPIVLLGLGFYYFGASLLQYCGIELWKRASDSERRDDHPSHHVIDHLVFTENSSRFTIHKSSGEHWTGLIFCLICGPGFSLISIDSVLISRVRYKLGFKYYVVFAPEKKPVADTFLIGLRDDVFPMSGEQTAQQFSERLSRFLGVRVEKAFK